MHGNIYKLNAFDGSGKQIKIIVDVTRSAQPFHDIGEPLKGVLDTIFQKKELDINNVLDMGAGKLHNVPYLLEQGKKVTAVEFGETVQNGVAKLNMNLCKSYESGFDFMTPDVFAKDKRQYDLVLLANVVQTVPLISARMEIMHLSHKKLKKGKYLLWFAQKYDNSYAAREKEGKKCEDGVWMGEGTEFKTFYKYYSPMEAAAIAHDSGFTPFDKFKPQTNHAILFRK